MLYENTRKEVLRVTMELYRTGLIHLTSGNISARASSEHVAITPGSVSYEGMQPKDIVIVDLEGNLVEGHFKPSSETPMHTLVFRQRPDINGVIHTHSTYALSFSIVGKTIPIVCTEGLGIGGEVPVAEYACPGTEEGGISALKALNGPPPVAGTLLRNHGVLAIGADLARAAGVAHRVEIQAQVYHLALQIGTPVTYTQEQISEVFTRYRRK